MEWKLSNMREEWSRRGMYEGSRAREMTRRVVLRGERGSRREMREVGLQSNRDWRRGLKRDENAIEMERDMRYAANKDPRAEEGQEASCEESTRISNRGSPERQRDL